MSPQTALEAVVWRRLPVSGWPWRSLGYLLATVMPALSAAALLALTLGGGLTAAPVIVALGGGTVSMTDA